MQASMKKSPAEYYLTEECSDAYYKMYQLCWKLAITEYEDWDEVEDICCAVGSIYLD